jgi:hypothetical protein
MMSATVTALAATGVRDQITRRAPISAAAVGEHLPQQERTGGLDNVKRGHARWRPRVEALQHYPAARSEKQSVSYPGHGSRHGPADARGACVLWAGRGSASLHDPNSPSKGPLISGLQVARSWKTSA